MSSFIPAGWRVGAAVLSCAVLAMAAAGCGAATSTTSANGGAPASASASATSSPPDPAGPLAGLTADQIASRAIADLKAASSFHVAGFTRESGQTYTVDLAFGTRDCKGTVALAGEGSILVLKKGGKVWLKPDDRFWRHMAGSSAAEVLSVVRGKYLEPSKGPDQGSLSSFCDRSGFTGAFDDLGAMSRVKATTISGRPALQIRGDTTTAYVTISAHPEILRVIDNSGHGHLDFTRYNAPVPVTAPPPSLTLQGARYGF